MFRTEAQRAQRFLNLCLPPLLGLCGLRERQSCARRFFKDLSAPFFVSFLNSVRSKTAWEVQRVSHRGTEGTEVFQRFVSSFLRVLFELCEIENGMGYIKSFARRHGGHGGHGGFSTLCLLLSLCSF